MPLIWCTWSAFLVFCGAKSAQNWRQNGPTSGVPSLFVAAYWDISLASHRKVLLHTSVQPARACGIIFGICDKPWKQRVPVPPPCSAPVVPLSTIQTLARSADASLDLHLGCSVYLLSTIQTLGSNIRRERCADSRRGQQWRAIDPSVAPIATATTPPVENSATTTVAPDRSWWRPPVNNGVAAAAAAWVNDLVRGFALVTDCIQNSPIETATDRNSDQSRTKQCDGSQNSAAVAAGDRSCLRGATRSLRCCRCITVLQLEASFVDTVQYKRTNCADHHDYHHQNHSLWRLVQ